MSQSLPVVDPIDPQKLRFEEKQWLGGGGVGDVSDHTHINYGSTHLSAHAYACRFTRERGRFRKGSVNK